MYILYNQTNFTEGWKQYLWLIEFKLANITELALTILAKWPYETDLFSVRSVI